MVIIRDVGRNLSSLTHTPSSLRTKSDNDIRRTDSSLHLRTNYPAIITRPSSFTDFFTHATNLPGCLSSATLNSVESTERPLPAVIPGLLRDMRSEPDVAALRQIYSLCDNRHRHNRIPLLSSSRWNILAALLHRLDRVTAPAESTSLVCLTLNNLAIPYQNKAVMAVGPNARDLLLALCRVIEERRPEACICIIVLVNLSLHRRAIEPILYFPSVEMTIATSNSSDTMEAGSASSCCPKSNRRMEVLDNPHSLLRIIETTMNTNRPGGVAAGDSPVSVESETVRWACGLVSNLSINLLNAQLIAQTTIPRQILQYLARSATHPNTWTVESVEDFALRVINRLAWWPPSRVCLMEHHVESVMAQIASMAEEGESCVYTMRAAKIAAFLDAKRREC
mmetsp:Transcript_29150/g.35522  ORF Transcript_29150/g.35522 Transcript_29150/m.35522 type:complete len:395 (-) Transcript_29150:171-1355(-)|eukprot:CAMPEP_0172493314 /NCGR_PEP_ID=MMETSP1066-20121228/24718_1 /TAXON_ID=671091 /ORGANISM="Coscinodiscus wailesii, Strain CCMP2513" /LENGTH=394 /DNA_ID=CAMNT_0013263415 /DNA_START=36 /DNA_END=1220 /DNA_ORIENTATION=+